MYINALQNGLVTRMTFVLQYWNVVGGTVDLSRTFTRLWNYNGTCIFTPFTHD